MPMQFSASRFSDASLAGQRSSWTRRLESSLDAGWTSTLMERHSVSAGHVVTETPATPDTHLVAVTFGSYELEVLSGGRWRGGRYHPGSAGMTASGQVDRLRCTASAPFEVVHLYVPKQIVSEAAEHLRRAGQLTYEDRLTALMVEDPALIGSVQSLLFAMRAGAPDLFAEQAMRWLAMHLLVKHGGASVPTQPLISGGSVARRLSNVVELMRSRYSESLPLEMLAREAGVSKFHFARTFRQHTGSSPHAFLTLIRMSAACELLASTDHPVSHIAHRVGYSSPERFAAAFRATYGRTPTSYRRD